MSKRSLMSEIIRFIFQIFDELSRKNNIEWKMFFLKNSEIYQFRNIDNFSNFQCRHVRAFDTLF